MGAVFGALVAATLVVAMLSGEHVRQKLALVLLLSWAADNVAVNYLGFVRAPLMLPSLDVVALIMVGLVGHRNRSWQALAVFGLYVAVVIFHLGAYIFRIQGAYGYYATLNVLFLAQLLTVGGSSAWLAVRRWADRGRERLRPDASRS